MPVAARAAQVRSRRGEIELRLKVSHREAVSDCFDPYGKIPKFKFKFCSVSVR